MSPTERELMKTYTRDFSETPPPSGDVRPIAEWEPMESVIIAYDGGFGIPLSAIAEMSEDCNITTIVSGPSEETSVRNIFNNNGVILSHCSFVHQDPNTWWTRDYSPWFIAVDDTEIAIVDFPYNRPRPNDDEIPILMADILDVDLYGMNIEHTGGNYMNDGYGIAVSTDLVWEENLSQTHNQIAEKFQNYLGVNTYHVTADPLDDYIKHVDCWAKFLDVDKILITQVPETDYRYQDYEDLAIFFSQQNCSWGYPYEVYRVQAADYDEYDTNPYTNSLILNDKVFVPQSGSDLDDDAIALYQQAMPGYEIIGVYSSQWYNSDALHCRTHGIADREMLHIKHIPLHGEVIVQSSYIIEAEIFSYGGSALSPGYPILNYRVNSGEWNEILMTNTSGNSYNASIPAIGGNNTVEYFIEAQNQNGKSETHPYIGQADPHIFNYSGEGVLSNPFSEICIGSSTGTITLTNYYGTITDWERRFNNGSWESLNHTGETYSETLNEAGTWDYRVELDNGINYSTTASILVDPLTIPGAVTGGSEICEGNNTGTLTLNDYTGNIMMWQKQLNEGAWIDISNTSATYNEIPAQDGLWLYRALLKSGVCSEEFSSSAEVYVLPAPISGFTYTTEGLMASFTDTSVDADAWSWDFGDGYGSTAQNPSHNYASPGSFTVTLTAFNGNCEDIHQENINVSEVSVNDLSEILIISPNPCNGIFTIKNIYSQATLRIYDLNGKELHSSILSSAVNTVDVSYLSNGIYLIETTENGLKNFQKMIIRK
jgi:agmatine/peptidylarginine deiminase/PKD repeat protein